MEQLSVTVRGEDGVSRCYRFDETPISIGRSPECDISILHEAVPRHLCRVWLEEGGRRVRVEERPGLTNALELNGRAIEGGASGAHLSLRVGPIAISLSPSGTCAEKSSGRRPLRSRLIRSLPIVAATIAASLALIGFGPHRIRGTRAVDALPESLFAESVPMAPPPSGDAEADRSRASLSSSRAEEILSRASATNHERVEAILDLRIAASLFEAAGDKGAASACKRKAAKGADEIDRAWRRDRLALVRDLDTEDEDAISASASRLADYLSPSMGEPRRALLLLIEPPSRNEKEASR